MEKDYYSILGVTKTASADEIKKAYRKLALQHHPDRNKGNKASEEKFKEVTKAYEVLSDPGKKQTYDQFGKAAFEQGAGGGAGGPFGGQGNPFTYTYSSNGGNFDFGGFSDPFDIFEQFFGGGNPFSQRAQRRSTYSLTISFMDAIKGATKKVNMDGRTQNIKIPAGVDTGSRIRFGDSDVVIEVIPDKKFKREGYDIVTDEELSFPQAALGEELDVETVQGPVSIKIPAGTQPETLIRLRGKGVKSVNSSTHGDHYVRIKIVIPKSLSSRQKELLKELDSEKKKSGWF